MDILEILNELVCTFYNKIILIGGGIIYFLLKLCGDDGEGIHLLLILVVIDFITGLAKGITTSKVSSFRGSKGIIKKAMLFVAIIVAHHMDIIFSQGDTLKNLMLGMIYVNELISIFENLELMGVPFPNKLKKILEQCKDKK